jgi:hypothetical protein
MLVFFLLFSPVNKRERRWGGWERERGERKRIVA